MKERKGSLVEVGPPPWCTTPDCSTCLGPYDLLCTPVSFFLEEQKQVPEESNGPLSETRPLTVVTPLASVAICVLRTDRWGLIVGRPRVLFGSLELSYTFDLRDPCVHPIRMITLTQNVPNGLNIRCIKEPLKFRPTLRLRKRRTKVDEVLGLVVGCRPCL